jgi:signal transduction histidine kinase
VEVEDNGKGISRHHQEKIFRIDESFSSAGTRQEKGTGLGLILCKEFVEKHGGKIWVESEENQGSCFIFTLPLNEHKNGNYDKTTD